MYHSEHSLISKNQWEDRYNRVHDITKMSMTYIASCIKLIEGSIAKGTPWRKAWLPLLKKEYENRRGKM